MKIVAKKALGQNFLINEEILECIIDLIPENIENIVEIGPGTGNLTRAILNKYDKIPILSIEKDLQFQFKLVKIKQNYDNFDYVFNDVLQIDLSRYVGRNSLIIGNLPYNIATKILFNIFENCEFKCLIFMFQKEVAEKIVGAKRSHMEQISILTQLFSEPNLEFLVSNENFFPQPKIDSAIVSFKPRNNPLNNNQYQNLKKTLVVFFQQRRKKMSSIVKKLNNIDVNTLNNINIDPNARPENVLLEQWLALSKLLTIIFIFISYYWCHL